MAEYGGIASLVELLFTFGIALGFVGWQIIVTRRGIRADREAQAKAEEHLRATADQAGEHPSDQSRG